MKMIDSIYDPEFFRQAGHRLVDQLVLTMAPVYIGGMQAVWPLQINLLNPPRLENMAWEMCGSDLVLRADITWHEP